MRAADTGGAKQVTASKKHAPACGDLMRAGQDASRETPAGANKESARPLRPAAFFDRDGVLNYDYGFVHSVADFAWTPGAKKSISACNRAGLLVFVVTNQSGIARGVYSESDVHALHVHMQTELHALGAHIDAFAFCPHHPEGIVPELKLDCSCRKPRPGMLLRLCREWSVDRENSFLIGDRPSDIAAAAAAGIRGILYSGGDLYADILPLLRAAEERGRAASARHGKIQ